MEMQHLLVMILVGAVAGWLAGQVVKGRGLGLIGDIVVGILGSFVATWLLPKVGVYPPAIGSGIVNSIIWSAIGAIILLLVVGLVAKRR